MEISLGSCVLYSDSPALLNDPCCLSVNREAFKSAIWCLVGSVQQVQLADPLTLSVKKIEAITLFEIGQLFGVAGEPIQTECYIHGMYFTCPYGKKPVYNVGKMKATQKQTWKATGQIPHQLHSIQANWILSWWLLSVASPFSLQLNPTTKYNN